MTAERQVKIRNIRLQQPLSELERKRSKAFRRSVWTQEDLDHAEAFAKEMLAKIRWEDSTKQHQSRH